MNSNQTNNVVKFANPNDLLTQACPNAKPFGNVNRAVGTWGVALANTIKEWEAKYPAFNFYVGVHGRHNDVLMARFNNNTMAVCILDGTTTIKDIEKTISAFVNHPAIVKKLNK